MTSSSEHPHDLPQAVCDLILSSFQADADILHFAQSTLGLDTSAEIRAAVATRADPSDPELESLRDLLLSPSLQQREAIETALQAWDSSRKDTDELVRALMDSCPQARIAFPDGAQMVLDLDRDMMQGIVDRLRPGFSLPGNLEQVVAGNVPQSWQAWVRVRMRLANVRLAGARADFLAAVLTHVPASSPLFPEYFTFALAFVQECPEDQDMAQALAAKKEYLEHSLDRAAFLERQRTSQAMEALLMQRLPMLSIDTAAAQREIRIINDISLALYGRVPGSFDQTCQESTFQLQQGPGTHVYD